MNRRQYLSSLDKMLVRAGVDERAVIIKEYVRHFDMKLLDGYSEEEIIARLPAPEEVAGQYGEISPEDLGKGFNWQKVFKMAGLICVHVFVWPFIVLLFTWVVSLAAVTVGSAIGGAVCIVVGRSVVLLGVYVVYIPDMPYISAVLFGAGLLAFAVLSLIGMEFFRIITVRICRAFFRWHRRVLGKEAASQPPQKKPMVSPLKDSIMRVFAVVALALLVFAFCVAFISMMIVSGSLEPWHVWGWFG